LAERNGRTVGRGPTRSCLLQDIDATAATHRDSFFSAGQGSTARPAGVCFGCPPSVAVGGFRSLDRTETKSWKGGAPLKSYALLHGRKIGQVRSAESRQCNQTHEGREVARSTRPESKCRRFSLNQSIIEGDPDGVVRKVRFCMRPIWTTFRARTIPFSRSTIGRAWAGTLRFSKALIKRAEILARTGRMEMGQHRLINSISPNAKGRFFFAIFQVVTRGYLHCHFLIRKASRRQTTCKERMAKALQPNRAFAGKTGFQPKQSGAGRAAR